MECTHDHGGSRPIDDAAPAATGARSNRRVQRTKDTPLPDMLEVLALSGIFLFPQAAAVARSAGGPLLFADPVASRISDCLLSDGPIDLSGLSRRDARSWLQLTDDFRPAYESNPTDPSWAVDVVRRLARERIEVWAIPTLRWAADALEAGWCEFDAVAAEVVRLVGAAEGRGGC